MLNYSTKCFLNSLKCTKIAAAGTPPQTTLVKLTAIPMPMMYVVGNEKTGTKFLSLLVKLVGLIGCVPDLTGNNLANFVCNYQKFPMFE